MKKNKEYKKLGCGVGLRTPHFSFITANHPDAGWFEAISENFMDSGGRPIAVLEEVRKHYPVALHGVSLSIGSVDPLNKSYLSRLKNLVERIQPVIVSDHLCWSGAAGEQLHDLLPLPFTEESVRHIVRRVEKVQDFLKRPILLENVSTYVTFKQSTMPEWQFLSEVSRRSGCGILLDLNNIYVNAKNHGFNPYHYLAGTLGEKVGQFHLAGHTDLGTHLFDTHSTPVIDEVWNLYREALRRWGQIPTLIEWDENIPEWPRLMEERAKAQQIYESFSGKKLRDLSLNKSVPAVYPSSKTARAEKSLHKVQSWMKSAVKAKPAGSSPLKAVEQRKMRARVAAYSEGYKARIYLGLSEVYETVCRQIGGESFFSLSQKYAARYPSKEYNLGLVGRYFPDFLRRFQVKGHPYLEELARFEWRLSEAFHASEEKPFDRGQLEKIPAGAWENIKLVFQPTVSIFVSSWPVLDLWKKRLESAKPGKVQKKRQLILIGRKGFQLRCELLSEDQHILLRELLKGRTLGQACEKLSRESEAENPPVAQWFSAWVSDGLIVNSILSGRDKSGTQRCESLI